MSGERNFDKPPNFFRNTLEAQAVARNESE
jgi:hypothetical protein